MSRLSFRPRPLDQHKKLPILKSIKDFDDFDEAPTSASTRNSQILRIAATEPDEAQQIPTKKASPEIPTPQFVDVDTYKRDYLCTFTQPTSYLRGRGAHAELGDFVEYDLDNEDEDWLAELKNESDVEQIIITPEKLESILFKLEVLDHKARERAGIMTATIGLPIPILLQPDAAMEALQALFVPFGVFDAVYKYWKCKRERWHKPILRRLQPPPSVNDTNPYNVFRPREKAHRLHTRRMQRRENNVQSFEKLRQVRRNLDQAKMILEALIKREEKKREFMENEVNLQRIQMKYKHEAELIQDSLTLPGYQNSSSKFGSSDEEFVDSDDASRNPRPGRNTHFREPRQVSMLHPKRESRRQHAPTSWLHKLDADEPIMLFTKPLDAAKLALAGIVPPSGCKLRGRMGRGGRIVFDRCDPLMRLPINAGTPKQRSTVQFI